MADHIVHTRLLVDGVRTDAHVKQALQALYDVFAELGLGQATFELTGSDTAELYVKHQASVTPDIDAINRALAEAGDFRVVG